MTPAGSILTTTPSSYRTALQFERSARGSYDQLDYEPTFRASALFFVMSNDALDTRLTFMNYWREKNGNDSVAVLATLRDEAGHRLVRRHLRLAEDVHALSVSDLLVGAGEASDGRRFVGSLELEFFSTDDLKYAMPAVEAFYVSRHGVSMVHAGQRSFNGLADEDRNTGLNPAQTGFDVVIDQGRRPFVAVVNGPRPVAGAQAQVVVANQAGDEVQGVVELGHLAAYGAAFVDLAAIAGVAELVGKGTAYARIDVPTAGVFNRFVCGTADADLAELAVTHSFYDCQSHDDYCQRAAVAEGDYLAYLPFGLVPGLELDVVLYPIYAPAMLELTLHRFSRSTGALESMPLAGPFDGAGTQTRRIDVRGLLADGGSTGEDDSGGDLYCLEVAGVDGQVPMRMTVGLNYRPSGDIGALGSGAGCNISTSVIVNPGFGRKQRSWLWGPALCRDDLRNFVVVANVNPERSGGASAETVVTLHNRDGIIGRQWLVIERQGVVRLEVEAMLERWGYQGPPEEFVWYTVEARSPDLTATQLCLSTTGKVGGDHSF